MLEVSSWVTTNIEWGLRVAAGNRWNVCHRNMEGTSSSQLCATLDEAGRANGYHADGDTTTFSERSAISPGLRRPASAVQTYKCLNARCRNDGILLGCARGRPERTHQHRMHVRIRLGLRCFEVQVRVTVQPSARSGRRPMIIMIQMISFRTFSPFCSYIWEILLVLFFWFIGRWLRSCVFGYRRMFSAERFPALLGFYVSLHSASAGWELVKLKFV